MMSRHSARSLLLALGILVAAPVLVSAHTAVDPLGTPLWPNGVLQATALDSLPARLNRHQLLSFPVDPTPNTVSGIFGDELGAYNNTVYRIGHWEPTRTGIDKYIEFGDASTITHGHGYWLITRDSVKVRFNGNAAPADTFELPLSQGPNGAPEWNQLGNPFTFNTAVAGWRLVKRDSLLTLGQAASRTWIDANMRTYNASSKQYTASGTIGRGAGFFSRLIDPDTSLQWTRWSADTGSSVGFWSSVKLDSKGNPHVAFYKDGVPGLLRYATRKNNTWTVITLDQTSSTFNGVWASIDLDSLDLPHVAYFAATSGSSGRLMYIRKQAGGAFTIPEQIEPVNNGYHVKLKLWHGVPRVAYVSRDDATLRYAEKNIGGWVVEPASALAAGNLSISDGDIGFDVNRLTGRPHIVSPSTNSPAGLRYVTKVGSTWSSELVDTLAVGETGIAPSIALDAAGVPHISYFDKQNVDLRYARRTGTSWTLETVDATGNTGNYSEIMIQPNGTPSIAFLEFASMGVNDRIRYARRLGGGWQIETVDDVGVSSSFAFLGATLDPQGNPRVTYQGQRPSGFQELRYAEKIRGSWRIKIPPVPAPEPPAASEAKPAGAAWAVAITARQNGNAAEPLYLGVAGNEAIAALRSAKAPAPPDGGMLSLSVPRGTEEFVRDFQTAAETVRWSFRTDGGVAPGEQSLDFAGFDLPAGMRLFLTDPDHGWTREVHAGESVSLAARPRTFELVATTGEDGPAVTVARDGLSFAYPNPFGRNTGLAFTLAKRGDIRVDLFDVTGRRVRTMERAGAAAGEHVLTWDGRDGDGRPVPSGIYLAAWRAGGTQGSRRLVKVE